MGTGEVFTPGDALRTADILYVATASQAREDMRRQLLSLGAGRVQVAKSRREVLNVLLGTPSPETSSSPSTS